MKVVIDKRTMTFLPIKHADVFVIGNLVWIECPQAHAHVAGLDHSFLKGFTDLELMLLYKNTTGQTAMRVGDSLRNILFELAERIPVREVNAFELDRQASLVPEDSKEPYLYAPGQMKAAQQPPLFKLASVKVTRAENETIIAARPAIKPPAPTEPAPGTTLAGTPAQRAPRAAGVPRTGGVRELIWQVADRMYEAAGKPTDVKVVLNLRKEMMGVLESEHNVKRTSSSNELGNWMKARMP